MAYNTGMNRLKLFFALILTGFFTSVACADQGPPTLPDKENFKIFRLAGQSNMAGRGEVTDDDLKIHPRGLMLAKDGSWQYAVDPIHYDTRG